MKRLIIILSALLLGTFTSNAQKFSKKFHYGVEWGINYAAFSSTYSTFITDEGYVVESKDATFNGHLNGTITGYIGYSVGRRFGLYAFSGYMGVRKKENVIPLTLRGVWALDKSPKTTGSSIYIEGGFGFRKNVSRPVLLSRIGYIYTVRLTSRSSLMINGGILVSHSHPDVYDKYSDKMVERKDLGISNSLNIGPICTLGLEF